MKFEELSDKDKSYIKVLHGNTDIAFDKRVDILKERFGKSERTVRRWIKKLGFSKFQEVENDEVRNGKLRLYDKSKKYYLLTWAQNATPCHLPFWDNLKAYAKHLDADIGVLVGRYTNPTSIFSETLKSQEYWDDCFSVKEDGLITFSYLDGSRSNLHKTLDIIGDIRTVPTASNPLTNTDGLSGDRSCIVGHPAMHLRSLPVLEGHHKKIIATTGACTVKNYTDTKSGKLGEFNHTLGAVIVEIKNDEIHYIRQITANYKDGSFNDLIYRVEDGVVSTIDSCEAFVFGDLHVDDLEEAIVKETVRYFGKVRPKKVFAHDIFNGSSTNHHEAKDPIKVYHKFIEGKNIIRDEIGRIINFIEKYNLTDYGLHVVRSNHDLWADRYIKEGDWKRDPANCIEYLEYALALLNKKAPKGIIPYVLDNHFGDKITCLGTDESVKCGGWELAQHGHLGTNGSKGSIEGYSRLNTKVIVGDYHTPNRRKGAISVGTYSKLRVGYNEGASAWGWAGAVVHNDGKAQLLIFGQDKKCSTLF